MKIILDLDSYWVHDKNLSFYKERTDGSWLYYFIKLIEQSFYMEVVLAEEYLQKKEFSNQDVIISERYASNYAALLDTGACPLIIFTGEPPNVDWKFYSCIYKYTKPYRHAFLFSGSQKYISESVIFHPIHWPNDLNNRICAENLPKEKLVMVAANKKQGPFVLANNKENLIRTVIMKICTNFIPSMKLVDLYPFRMKAIVHFSNKDYFQLYGRDWDKQHLLTKKERDALQRINPTEVDNKHLTLAKYQFALCFENCIYPGYVTEKIFDCFLAQCIPVYYGAPDIDQHVPKNTFIDMRDFKNFKELEIFLENISDQQISEYLHNINSYLKGEEFFKYTGPYFAKELFQIVHTCYLVNASSQSDLTRV